jgi:rubrerythrin
MTTNQNSRMNKKASERAMRIAKLATSNLKNMSEDSAKGKDSAKCKESGDSSNMVTNENAGGSCCNPWDGPWVCEKCNGWWESLKMYSKPEYCPICGKAPIRRATIYD